jgi:hypothetical protein
MHAYIVGCLLLVTDFFPNQPSPGLPALNHTGRRSHRHSVPVVQARACMDTCRLGPHRPVLLWLGLDLSVRGRHARFLHGLPSSELGFILCLYDVHDGSYVNLHPGCLLATLICMPTRSSTRLRLRPCLAEKTRLLF